MDEGSERVKWHRSFLRALAHRLHQYLYHLGSGELARRHLPLLQHLTYFGTAERDMLLAAMRAGLGGGHRLTGTAEKGVLKEQGRDAELVRLELCEDVVGIIGTIVGADPGMIASHDEMRAAIVF